MADPKVKLIEFRNTVLVAEILDNAKAQGLRSVVLFGETEDGWWYAASPSRIGDSLVLAELLKREILRDLNDE